MRGLKNISEENLEALNKVNRYLITDKSRKTSWANNLSDALRRFYKIS